MFDPETSPLHRLRPALRKLPRTTETLQWGGNLVFWTLHKALGGKMFALINLEPAPGSKQWPILAFAAGPLRAPALLELDGITPAPYLARAHWVALADWRVLPHAQLLDELTAAHAYVSARMPPRTQRLQALPLQQYRAALHAATHPASAK